jgi:hypothetical protein
VADSTPAAPAEAAPFDIEKPACFYLGREYDLARRAVLPDRFVMYDARDLTTHGVIVGMTGSGKTGLAIGLLEEAAIDGIPSIIIDPKGDLTNLLLQFPGLAPTSFEPWVDAEDARQKGLAPKEYAEKLADRWRKGLEETAQPADRVARLKASSDWRVYTPGSESGLPLSILSTFAAPKGRLPREALTQKIDATATALLGLTGLAADPVQSREHILIAQLLLHAWTAGRDLDLPRLILEVQTPPIGTVGAYNLETFFPSKDRLKFASLLNNVLAAPSFSTWTMGEPLDLASMLYRAGRPQQLIFYVAHLDDTQRMFFITLLLEEVLSWVRRQPGTSNLRALLYFDEVFGYLPPHPANPPSKGPLLTLLKQARAFGVGILLATQNPVDLDYKALSNAGTWFVGKLQTERDKARLLEGLESIAAERGTLTDRSYVETVISSLGGRVFLMHDVHRPAPLLFQSRWTLSYLRGPLMLEQVERLMGPLKERPPAAIPLCTHCHAELGPEVGDRCPGCGRPPWANAQVRLQDQQFRAGLLRAAASSGPATPDNSVHHLPPVLPPDVRQFYLPAKAVPGAALEYQPGVLGFAEVVFPVDKRKGKEHRLSLRWLAAPAKSGRPIDWAGAQPVGEQFDAKPLPSARWASVPESLDTGRKLKALEKAFADYVYSTQKLALYENRALGLVSEPGEAEASFRGRCRLAAQEKILKGFEMERAKFGPKFETLDAELPDEAGAKKGGSFWGGLLNFGGSPAKKAKGAGKQEEKLRKLQADYQAKRNEIEEKWKHAADEVAPVEVKPRKADVRVTHFGLAWVPR